MHLLVSPLRRLLLLLCFMASAPFCEAQIGAQPWTDLVNIYGSPINYTGGGLDEQHHIWINPADHTSIECYFRIQNRYAQKLTIGLRVYEINSELGKPYEDTEMTVGASALSGESEYFLADNIDHLAVLYLQDAAGNYLFGGPNYPPITPSSGSQLPPPPNGNGDGTTPITPPPVSGATFYQVLIGATPGASNFFSSPQQSGPSTVQVPYSSLPGDGSVIYVRVNYYLGSTWQFYDYTYRAPKSSGHRAPTVTLASSPLSPTAPAAVSITATATASGATLTKVELFQGTTSFGTRTAPPYSWSWTGLGAGTYTSWTAVATDSLGASTTSAPLTFTVNSTSDTLPVIMQEPQAQNVAPGQTASFSVFATGPNLTYLWRKKVINGTDAPRATQLTGPSLTISSVTSADAGQYLCYVTNGAGTVPSNAAQLTIVTDTLPVITQQPQAVTVAPGGDATLRVQATGPNLTYSWSKVITNGSTTPRSTNTTSASLTISAATVDDAGTYQVYVTNGAGSVPSNTVQLSVVEPVAASLLTPTSGSTLAGSSATFTWDAGTGSGYRLYVGSTLGNNDLYDSGQVQGLSQTVTGLPTDGETLFVRLSSMLGANWVARDYQITAASQATTPSNAAITSPVAGSVLSSEDVTFQWTPGVGVTQYALWVGYTSPVYGSFQYGHEYYYNYVAGLSQTVHVPAGSGTVYATLFTLVDGVWQYVGTQYTAMAGSVSAPRAAAMLAPSAGSALPGSSATFSWDAGVGVDTYALWVGSTMPIANSFSQGMEYFGNYVSGTSQTVYGLPTNGIPIYVTLFSHLASGWSYTTYTYSADQELANPPRRAHLTSPVSGAALTDVNLTCTWDAGVAVDQYALWVGTSAPVTGSLSSGHDLFYNYVSGGQQQVAVPAEGETIWVTLFSSIGGQWQWETVTCQAPASGGGGGGSADPKSVITSPVSTALTSDFVTFTWSAGSGVSGNALWVGSSEPVSGSLAFGHEFFYNYVSGGSQDVYIPSDGNPVYVTLFSWIDGAWQWNSYLYTAAGGSNTGGGGGSGGGGSGGGGGGSSGPVAFIQFDGSQGILQPKGFIQATDGKFYGTCDNDVFSFETTGATHVMEHFTGVNGSYPGSNVMQASDGNLYGVTSAGGAYGNGTVFQLTLAGAFQTFLNFNATSEPMVPPVQGSDLALYGTTLQSSSDSGYFGSVYRITLSHSASKDCELRSFGEWRSARGGDDQGK